LDAYKILENGIIVYLADHGSELDYFVGTWFNCLTAKIANNEAVITLSPTATIAITVGWNYLDGLYDFILAAKELAEKRNYRQTYNKIQAALNIFTGVQLFVLSYNPILTTFLGLANATDLAGSSFALSTFFDWLVAGIELYNTYRELSYNPWLHERLTELNFKLKHGHQAEELIEKIRLRCKNQISKKPEQHQHIAQTIQNRIPHYHADVRNQLTDNLTTRTRVHKVQNQQLETQLRQAFVDSRTNFTLKTLSFLGMTLLAVNHFLEESTQAASQTLIIGLATTTYVAAAYAAYNNDRLYNGIGMLYNRFFSSSIDPNDPEIAEELDMDPLQTMPAY